jgi:hypothetical protein
MLIIGRPLAGGGPPVVCGAIAPSTTVTAPTVLAGGRDGAVAVDGGAATVAAGGRWGFAGRSGAAVADDGGAPTVEDGGGAPVADGGPSGMLITETTVVCGGGAVPMAGAGLAGAGLAGAGGTTTTAPGGRTGLAAVDVASVVGRSVAPAEAGGLVGRLGLATPNVAPGNCAAAMRLKAPGQVAMSWLRDAVTTRG